MSSTVISFASGIAIMGAYDAMFRLYFDIDDKEYRKAICSTALFFAFCNSMLVLLFLYYEGK